MWCLTLGGAARQARVLELEQELRRVQRQAQEGAEAAQAKIGELVAAAGRQTLQVCPLLWRCHAAAASSPTLIIVASPLLAHNRSLSWSNEAGASLRIVTSCKPLSPRHR